jgi:serine acetyltransferase
MISLFDDLCQDANYYHQQLFPGHQPRILTMARVLFCSRGLFVLAVHRLSKLRPTTGPAVLFFKLLVRIGLYLSHVFAKSHILECAIIEPGVFLSNRGYIILGARTVGKGTIINEHVTIGTNLTNGGIPDIGQNVWIGPHCVISGDIRISDGVTVLPGSILTKSLPPGVTVCGNPAVILKNGIDCSELRSTIYRGSDYK